MVRAKDLKNGQELLNVEGGKEVIVSLEEKEFFGMGVYLKPFLVMMGLMFFQQVKKHQSLKNYIRLHL